MKKAIKIIDNDCFIDSDELAILADTERRSITRLILNHKAAIESFGVLRFEITKPGEEGGRPKTVYLLNEQQATLLTTFMRNSERVVEFKKRLVREFFLMREYIQKQETARLVGKEVRKELTESVSVSGENERMHGHGYSNYTKLVYELANVNFEYKQFKSDQKIVDGYNKMTFRDVLTSEQLRRVEGVEMLVRAMVDSEKQYSEIKGKLKPLFEKKELEK